MGGLYRGEPDGKHPVGENWLGKNQIGKTGKGSVYPIPLPDR